MRLAFETSAVAVYQGHVLDVLREFPAESVDCVVTSPPYWGLRDYGVAGQIGLEKTPDEYVAVMVEVFREVRRVMRGRATLWLNLGDSYAGSWGAQGRTGSMAARSVMQARSIAAHPKNVSRTGSIDPASGLKPKDMVGIPWRVAFALQADGWYLRGDIIWSKPNPMPESVTDRPTKAHEYVFLLSKSERYFYDTEAVAEPAIHDGSQKMTAVGDDRNDRRTTPGSAGGSKSILVGDTRNARSVWTIAMQPYPEAHFATFPRELPKRCIKAGCPEGGTVLDPFAGSGTTLAVARDLGRKSIGIELNPDYIKLIEKRCAQLTLEASA